MYTPEKIRGMQKQFNSYQEAHDYYADCLLVYNSSKYFEQEIHDLIELEDLRCVWTDEIVTIGELDYLE